MSQGHTGGHRAPASWSPAALRPQGHSHGIQLSLPLSKVDQSPRQVPAAPASSAPLQGTAGQRCACGGERTPLPLKGLPRGGCLGTFLNLSAPSGAGAQSCFGGLHIHPWQEGSGGLTSHSWVALPGPPPPGRREGLCCTIVLPVFARALIVFISGIFLRERGQW